MQDFSLAFQTGLGALFREWERRNHSLQCFNPQAEEPRAPSADGGVSLLLAGPPGGEVSAAREALEQDGVRVAWAPAPGAAAELLGASAFDAMIVTGGECAGEYRTLLAAMKMHPRLNGLPVLAVTAPGQTDMSGLARHGVTVSAGPAGAESLRRWVRDAVLHTRLKQALSHAFMHAEPQAAGSTEGIFSNPFARTHLETLLASHHAARVCLAQFEMTFSGARAGGAEEGFRKAAARRLSALMPAGVMVSDAPPGAFWLLFPETGAEAAGRVLNSAAQSLRARPVTCSQTARPVEIYPRFRTLTAGPGDNVLAVVQRCGTLRPERPGRTVH
ncbi:MAG: hypothetical protein ACLFV8_14140 [Alphaproteobacteria bacterium]